MQTGGVYPQKIPEPTGKLDFLISLPSKAHLVDGFEFYVFIFALSYLCKIIKTN